MVAGLDDLVGCELAGGALSLAMDCSDMLLRHPDAVEEAGMAIAAICSISRRSVSAAAASNPWRRIAAACAWCG